MTLFKHSIQFHVILFLCFAISGCQQDNQRQNFVFILVDDLGWTDVSYNGSTFYETPHLDKLSQESVQFTNAYAGGSVCSPTRAAIMTGMHPARVNITDWIPGRNDDGNRLVGPQDLNELPLREITIAERLKEEGYSTFFAGKWHLGNEGYFPEDQGFDENHGGHHKGSPPGGYYSPYKNPRLSDGPDGEYLPDRLTSESISFLDRKSEEPFFLFLSYYTVHTPIQASRQHIDYFNQKLYELGDSITLTRNEGNGITRMNQNNADYASMVYAMDANIGRLISALKDRDLYDNTTLIFTSDNGGLSTLQGNYKKAGPTAIRPLRAGKGWLYEGGIRVPLLVKPARNHSAKVVDEPVISQDFFPTICDLASIEIDQNHQDGQSLTSILLDEDVTELKRDEIFWHYPHYHGSGWTPGAAIRKGDWKLIEFYETGSVELYNLKDDISETNDLSRQHPELVKTLSIRLKELQQSVNANHASINEVL